MQLADDQIDRATLSTLSAEAAELLANHSFEVLADRFGYALACGREPANAIEADLAASMTDASEDSDRAITSDTVTFLQSNDSNLFAVVTCVARMPEGRAVLVELVVTTKGTQYHLSLEDIGPV